VDLAHLTIVDKQLETYLPWARNYYAKTSLDLHKDNYFLNITHFTTQTFVNRFGFFRDYSFLFLDSQTFYENNKARWGVFVILVFYFDFIFYILFYN
jgi:hypothetical protein